MVMVVAVVLPSAECSLLPAIRRLIATEIDRGKRREKRIDKDANFPCVKI